MTHEGSRDWCLAQDAADPLARFRSHFALPKDVIYLDGNSLGARPVAAEELAADVIGQQWGQRLVASWNASGWFDLPICLGDRIARLIGAARGEVVVCDSTSINLHKVLHAAVGLRPGRPIILMEAGDFPTDSYIASALDTVQVRFVARHEIAEAIDETVAALCLTHAHYKSGALHDMADLTERAHRAGALAIWDISHSVGALPIELNGCGADFAVGCTYKYLNGGPGAPGFLFAAQRHQHGARQPLTGWWSHADPFAFDGDYRADDGIRRFLTGTPPIISMKLVEAGLDVIEKADLADIRRKSEQLAALSIQLMAPLCAEHGFALASPEIADQRGSHVSFSHPSAFPICQALADMGVIGDFRTPNLLRLGFAPLYIRFVDVWHAIAALSDIMESGVWRQERFSVRSSVT